jgi:hypothetical protein
MLPLLSEGDPQQQGASWRHLRGNRYEVEAGWFLSTNDKWAEKYFDPKDLHSVDHQLFG